MEEEVARLTTLHQISKWLKEEKFGKIIEVEAGFHHSSDLDPNKPINWCEHLPSMSAIIALYSADRECRKRIVAANGEYGCLGDLGAYAPLARRVRPLRLMTIGMHVVHIPFRFGFMPKNVRALFSKVVADRPGPDGKRVPCETWYGVDLLTWVCV